MDNTSDIASKPQRVVGIIRGMLRELVGTGLLDHRTQVETKQVLGRHRSYPLTEQLSQYPAEAAISSRSVGGSSEHLKAKHTLEGGDPRFRGAKAGET